MTELLLELYSEEIPAGMQEPAAKAFAEALGSEEYYFTPQRLVVVADMPDTQPDENIERKGPKIAAPEQAINGFMRSVGVDSVDELEIRNEVYFFSKQSKGGSTKDYLAKKIPEVLAGYTWPKSMRWGDHELRWVRPLHRINCVFGGEAVDFTFGHIKSGKVTIGHRFMSPNEFTISNFIDYKKKLEDNKVILEAEERKKLIRIQTRSIRGHDIKDEDSRLLNEVANLVEFPVTMIGEFPEEFLKIPKECLVSSMKKHQKYFPRYNHDGKLTNQFLMVSNLEAEDGGKEVIAGNVRVLIARLSDAKFFWDQDRKQKLEEFLPKLEKVTFHNKIGNMLEKAERISKLSGFIAERIGENESLAEKAGLLAKADLVTEMVGEFADLQGIMGGYYCDNEHVGQAIKEHYQPQGQNDVVPTNKLSICVALADKLDTLIAMFVANEKPTGSRDPFGLRRAALGIIRIILENNLRLNLRDFVKADDLFEFFIERLKYTLKAQNITHDVVDSVIGQGDDLLIIQNKAKALNEFIKTENGTQLLGAYNRAVNILSAEEKKDNTTYPATPSEGSQDEEKELLSAINEAESKITSSLDNEDFSAAMQELAKLQAPVNNFFDNVIVNDDDATTRENRLKLLAKIRSFMDMIANFSKIEG